jgi:hypothetical protein
MYYWRIMRSAPGGLRLVGGSLAGFATADLAREAARQERMANGWTLGDGYYEEVVYLDS